MFRVLAAAGVDRRGPESPLVLLLACAAAIAHTAGAAPLALAADSAVDDEPEAAAPMRQPIVEATIDEADAARLRALGYLDISTALPDTNDSGVTQLDRERAAPGHSLIVSSTDCSARLIDLRGHELRLWTQGDCRKWWGAALMRNGDLVVNGSLLESPTPTKPKQSSRFTARIAATGETLWLRMLRSHHQLDLTRTGEILILSEETLPERLAAQVRERLGQAAEGDPLTVHDNVLERLSSEGETLDRLSLYQAISKPGGAASFPFVELEKLKEGSSHLGLFHCNSAFALDQPQLVDTHPLYREHNVLLTSRNQNRIFIVNLQTGSLVWAWGENELQAPHYATWLANGNMLVFDNGIDRGRSRVVEVNPHSETIVWQYPSGTEVGLFTRTRGGAQRLANGNTLIVESNRGRAFEITPQGDLVWEYLTPVAEGQKKRPVVITLRRYPESWLEGSADSSESSDAAQ